MLGAIECKASAVAQALNRNLTESVLVRLAKCYRDNRSRDAKFAIVGWPGQSHGACSYVV